MDMASFDGMGGASVDVVGVVLVLGGAWVGESLF